MEQQVKNMLYRYKRLMHMYKTLKAKGINNDNNRMKKQQTKTEYIDQ